jgi:hypothetical protein
MGATGCGRGVDAVGCLQGRRVPPSGSALPSIRQGDAQACGGAVGMECA